MTALTECDRLVEGKQSRRVMHVENCQKERERGKRKEQQQQQKKTQKKFCWEK